MTKSKIQKQQNLGSLCYSDIMLLYVIPCYVYVDLSYVAMYMLYYVILCYIMLCCVMVFMQCCVILLLVKLCN